MQQTMEMRPELPKGPGLAMGYGPLPDHANAVAGGSFMDPRVAGYPHGMGSSAVFEADWIAHGAVHKRA